MRRHKQPIVCRKLTHYNIWSEVHVTVHVALNRISSTWHVASFLKRGGQTHKKKYWQAKKEGGITTFQNRNHNLLGRVGGIALYLLLQIYWFSLNFHPLTSMFYTRTFPSRSLKLKRLTLKVKIAFWLKKNMLLFLYFGLFGAIIFQLCCW